jgi:hypothetical protein
MILLRLTQVDISCRLVPVHILHVANSVLIRSRKHVGYVFVALSSFRVPAFLLVLEISVRIGFKNSSHVDIGSRIFRSLVLLCV